MQVLYQLVLSARWMDHCGSTSMAWPRPLTLRFRPSQVLSQNNVAVGIKSRVWRTNISFSVFVGDIWIENHWGTCAPSPWQLHFWPTGDGKCRYADVLLNIQLDFKREGFWCQINHGAWSYEWEPLMKYRTHRNRPSWTPSLPASTRVNDFQISGWLSSSVLGGLSPLSFPSYLYSTNSIVLGWITIVNGGAVLRTNECFVLYYRLFVHRKTMTSLFLSFV